MGKNNRGRGSPRGGPGGGRGGRGGARGRGRGGGGFRGRGRGGPPFPMAGAQQGGYHTLAEMDEVYLIAEDRNYKPPSGTSTPSRGRGSRGGRGSGPGTPGRGGFRGRGRGLIDDLFSPSKRGHGGIGDRSTRGRGGFSKGIERLRSDATLSDLLHQERPLLRPVVFVRSTLTATLFEEEEEIFRAGVEEIGDGEQSHQPTADRVFRLFSGTNHVPPIPATSDDSEAEVEEQLEEIDFNETEKLLDPTTALAGSMGNTSKDVEIIEERFTGIYINRESPPRREVGKEEEESIVIDENGVSALATSTVVIESQEEPMNVDPPAPLSAPAAPPEEQPLFYIDTTPTSITDLPPPPIVPSDDEEIVYVAPHPRGERATPALRPSPFSVSNPLGKVEEPVFQTTSVLTGTTITSTSASTASTALPSTITRAIVPPPTIVPTTSSLTLSFPTQTPSRPRQIPAFSAGGKTKAAVKQRQRDKRAERRRVEKAEQRGEIGFGKGGKGGKGGKRGGFGSFGGLVEEARLRDGGSGMRGRDPKWEERRRGDSDIEWGTDDEAPLPPSHLPSSSHHPNLHHTNIHPKDLTSGDDLAGEAEGMLVDPDISLDAMKAFVKSMGVEGGREVSMDDVGDEEMLRMEDSASNGAEGSSADEGAGSDEEVEGEEGDRIGRENREGESEEGEGEESEEGENKEKEMDTALEKEEELMIAEGLILELPPDSGEDGMDEEDEVSDDDGDGELDEGEVGVGGLDIDGEDEEEEDDEGEGEDEDEDDEDIDLSPGASFQARLERLREQSRKMPSFSAKGKGKGRMQVVNDSDEDEGDDGDDDGFLHNLSWAEQDEEFIAHIQTIMDENEAVLTGRDRKARKQLFTAIRNGDFDDQDGFKVARKKKDKYKDLPPALVSQWEKDRAKKAEYKKARELAKLSAAADPLVKKKGGKKGRKTMLSLRSLSPSLVVLPNRIIDLSSLVTQIRRFISDLSGPNSMPLPPTNKETRKAIHELATAFGLNSKSEGKGEGRYTVLKKTSRSGEGRVDERKVGRILRRFEGRGGGEFLSGAEWKEKNGGGKGKHREGDEVGKHAPKIGGANIGFQLLSRMGWSEGDRIGVTGGLEAPITALFKTSKLGLGATR